ncbi:ankyrin repeat-containing domain protein [Dichotomopilus funicola]|uniref:Ankyrin repeat-containing domain protein n=1 Tax=Dichotomopilus funicola TaxID=1934379 RepID=A0AAN6ZMQ1_9PEZI|nr:ankyrin repeat-containing domain protein [Dichotomopilus funicola]
MSDKNQLALGKVFEDESAIKFWLTFVALLLDAAETSRQEILGAMSTETLPDGSVLRSLAASQGAFHAEMREKFGLVEGEEFFMIRLPALVLGNPTERDKFAAELSSPSSAVWEFYRQFADVMSVALEYDDKAIIDKALELSGWDAISGGDETLTTVGLHSWSTLHAAAEHGSLEVIEKILESIHEDEISNLALSPRSPVFIAASHGFHLVVKQLLSVGIPVDGVDEYSGRTALHIASSLGCQRTVDILLREGADVTSVHKYGDFPLHLAIRHGHTHIAEQLLGRFPAVPQRTPSLSHEGSVASPADDDDVDNFDTIYNMDSMDNMSMDDNMGMGDDKIPNMDIVYQVVHNYGNTKGVSILMEAATGNLPELCSMALSRGVYPNFTDANGRIALHRAAKVGSVAMVKDLLSKNSIRSPGTRIDKCIPIHYACYRGFTEVVGLLAGVSDLSAKDIRGHTPLAAAAAAGHLDVVRLLYGHYNDDFDTVRALIAAAKQGQLHVMEYLLDSGCPVDGAGKDGSRGLPGNRLIPLLNLDPSKNSRAMQLLLARGADPDLVEETCKTALRTAASTGAYEAVKLLLDRGAKPDVETCETPLCEAIDLGRPNIVRLLLRRNARMRRPIWRDPYRTLLDFAMGESTRDVVAVLLDFYAKGKHEDRLTPSKALKDAMKISRMDFVELIFNHWLFVPEATTEASKAEAIQALVTYENVGPLRLLVQHPAMKKAINTDALGESKLGTPLHAAMLAGQQHAVDILMEAGADPNIHLDWKYYHCQSGPIDFDLCFKCYQHEHDIYFSNYEYEERQARDFRVY